MKDGYASTRRWLSDVMVKADPDVLDGTVSIMLGAIGDLDGGCIENVPGTIMLLVKAMAMMFAALPDTPEMQQNIEELTAELGAGVRAELFRFREAMAADRQRRCRKGRN